MKYVIVNSYNEIGYFEVLEEYKEFVRCKLRNTNGWINISKKDILKKGDTIDELIEFYIGIYDCGAREILDELWESISEDLDELFEDFENIYGVAMVLHPDDGTPIFRTIAKVNKRFKALELI